MPSGDQNTPDPFTAALTDIAEFAHSRSTGPAVEDDLWEVRRMAYDALDRSGAASEGGDWCEVLMSVAARLELPRSESGPPDDPLVYEHAIDGLEQLYTDELKRREEAEAKLFARATPSPAAAALAQDEIEFVPDPECTDAENEGLRLGTHYMAADCTVRPKPAPAQDEIGGEVDTRTGWWRDKLTEHWGEGISDDDTRRAACTVLGVVDRMFARAEALQAKVERLNRLVTVFTDGCPFTGRANDETAHLGPNDPCPACGMLGTLDADNRCLSTSSGRIKHREAEYDRLAAQVAALTGALESAKGALDELLPGPLCGEAWNRPDSETVQIVTSFGKLRRAREALASLTEALAIARAGER